jgi:hypothetical protein
MAENGAFFVGQNRHFLCLEPEFLNVSHWLIQRYVGGLVGGRERAKCRGAIFGARAEST